MCYGPTPAGVDGWSSLDDTGGWLGVLASICWGWREGEPIVVVTPLELGTQRKKKTYLLGKLALICWDYGTGCCCCYCCRGTEVVIIMK